MNKVEKLAATRAAAKALFDRVKPPGWKVVDQRLSEGGQAAVLVIEDDSGNKGVFRCLVHPNTRESSRFNRELGILTSPELFHPNIVRILAFSQNDSEHWYITPLGHQFKSRWPQFKEQTRDPEQVVHSAVAVIAALADGLSGLHRSGVVHRDIKPANIIIADMNGPMTPVLIDFGIAHVDYEDRLTPTDEAVGNKGYSPDVMMNRLEQVPPWLDVFQLSQLLIWMITAFPTWDRPLDWRWVNYDERLPNDLVLAIRAVTAVCSEQTTSPLDGGELCSLLHERFSISPADNAYSINLESIRQGISRGKSAQDITQVGDLRVIEASAADAGLFYRALRAEMQALHAAFTQTNVPVRVTTDLDFDECLRQCKAGPGIEFTLFELQLGASGSAQFNFLIRCVVFVPSLQEYINGPKLPGTSNIFTFYIQRDANVSRVQFPHITKIITLEKDGTIMLRGERMDGAERTDLSKIMEIIKAALEESEPWEMIHKDR